MIRRRSMVAVLVLVCLVLLTLDFRDGGGGPVAALQRGASALFTPLQEGFGAVVRPVGGFFSSIAEVGTLRDQNRQLREDNEALRDARTLVADLDRENADLRELLGMQQQHRLETTGARVVAAPPSSFEWTVLLDVGASAGVAEGMAVINADGFVGRVIEVTPTRSRVLLAASPDAGFVVRVAQTGDRGRISGQGAQPFRLEMDDADAEIPPDSQLVTQAFQGTAIPDGLPVGELIVPAEGPVAGRRFQEARPYVDFSRLGLVLVVLDAPEQPTELDPDLLIENPLAPRPDTPEQPLAPDPSGQAGDDPTPAATATAAATAPPVEPATEPAQAGDG